MAAEDNFDEQQAQAAEDAPKKKTSVKVVKRIKSKKSDKSDKAPELTPPSNGAPAELASNPSESRKSSFAQPSPVSKAAPQPIFEEPQQQQPMRVSSARKRMQRSGSNVFAMFSQNQVHQFKEAFGFIDQDKDGIISKYDIRASFDALGRMCTEKELDDMVSEAHGPINFTMFLSVIGDRISGTDDEEVVLAAFNQFDEGDGKCSEDKLRTVLTTWGNKFTKQECDLIFNEASIDSRGKVDIRKLATLVTRGAQDDQDE